MTARILSGTLWTSKLQSTLMNTKKQIRTNIGESGFSLIELMISMVVLLIGLGGLLV